MADAKSYAVRAAGSESRLGAIYKEYPYDLRALLEAMEDARLQSINRGRMYSSWWPGGLVR